VCDSKAWKCVNNTWPEFIVESWNIRLGELICRLINKSFYLVGPSWLQLATLIKNKTFFLSW
jgi:hypothetical protein